MDTSTHARHAELVQQHVQQGLSHADAAAAATAALGAEGAASAAASREATADGGGSEEVPDLVPGPDAKRQKTEGAGGEHAGGEHAGDGATAAGGLSSNEVGNKVDLPGDTGGADEIINEDTERGGGGVTLSEGSKVSKGGMGWGGGGGGTGGAGGESKEGTSVGASDGGGEEMRGPGPGPEDVKRHKTEGAHTGDGGTAAAAGGGLSFNAGGNTVGLPSDAGGAAGGGESNEGKAERGGESGCTEEGTEGEVFTSTSIKCDS